MTREEIERSFQYNITNAFIEWDKAVNAEYKEENEEAFYQGAYASQKYLIKKACEWLLNNAHLYVYATTATKRALLFNEFKRIMEE